MIRIDENTAASVRAAAGTAANAVRNNKTVSTIVAVVALAVIVYAFTN